MGWRVDDELKQMLRDSARHYLEDAGGEGHFRKVRASGNGFDAQAWSQMGELGWTGILLPESAGGSDLGLDAALTLNEELGRAIAPEPFVASAVIAATVLAASDSEAATSLASDLVMGGRTVTLAWQERRGSIGIEPFGCTVKKGRLSGTKYLVPAWHDGTGLLVAAMRNGETVVLVVDPMADGLTAHASRMTDGTFAADLSFDDVIIEDANVILTGEAADAALRKAYARGVVALCAQMEGLASQLWQITLGYMKQRSQFGSNLADFQALRHRMVDLYSEIELAGASWRRAAMVVEGGDHTHSAIHAAKARCSYAAQEMGRWAIQYHGAFGYTDEAIVGLYLHSALRWSTWLGNAAAHRRAALIAHRRERTVHV
ncbi:alkylation response protein AidB-like acyl-CoA dehydrogenase [Sphingobium xenophagum]|uniref:Alkylation response protein AidB-like acyl-CoA dehydrogenase n=1 Tax=Sphingobium xenophagum TaxID=121428 RepID=A0ABU1X5Q4_SPHXE|nr:acyl-CoA dehydrogenase family protein [Sphingobium xenophagum]MDR7156472.1 alkylation response protein AidB-like acyl-CoA dehydrogenase [Sphingobium xenophagum]